MGIPGFYGQWLSKYVRRAVVNGLPSLVSSLSFDLNGVFHEARMMVFGESSDDPRIGAAMANIDPIQLEIELQNAIANILLRIIGDVKPLDCLILAVDGMAPSAKMQQQKGRREKAARDRSPTSPFDGNAISPGTEFMINLDNFMVRFIGKFREHLPPKVIYSSHLVPGEGEHKIMDLYRKGEVSDGIAAKQGGAHVIYGLDADLIMLSLLSPVENIYLSRETVEDVIHIDSIKEYLVGLTGRSSSIDDFVIMMFLLGNDFLPHAPSLEQMADSINRLLDIYQKGKHNLADRDNHRIDWNGFTKFINDVASYEDNLLASLSTQQVTYPSRFLQGSISNGQFFPETFRNLWYMNALGPKGSPDINSALDVIIGTRTEKSYEIIISSMIIDYLTTFSWIYLYYNEGHHSVNLDWAYRYYHTPLFVDMVIVMNGLDLQSSIMGFTASSTMIPFTVLHQLVAILPIKSKNLLPEELQQLFAYNSPIRDLYPEHFIVELDGKNKEHEGVAIIPMIDKNRIVQAVSQIKFTANRLKRWLPAQDEIFSRPIDESKLLRSINQLKDRDLRSSRPSTQTTRGRGRAVRESQTTRGRGARATPTSRGRGITSTSRGRGVKSTTRGRGTSSTTRGIGRSSQYRIKREEDIKLDETQHVQVVPEISPQMPPEIMTTMLPYNITGQAPTQRMASVVPVDMRPKLGQEKTDAETQKRGEIIQTRSAMLM